MLKLNKTAVLTSLGAGLEYYDFIVYAFLAQYIGQLFFPTHDYYVSVIAAFGVFAVGYFVRPFGGIIFGIFGDKYGRKKVFLISILIMAFSTFIMGLIPSYHTIGLAGTFLFMFFRILQGISFGAELPGATTFITEHSSNNRRGLNCSIMVSFVTIGVLSGSFVVYLMTQIFPPRLMFTWGWRIPFLFGGILALIAYLIRIGTEESPYFEQNSKREGNPLLKLITSHWAKLLLCCGFILLPCSLVMFVLAMPTLFSNVYALPEEDVYLAITFGYGWSIITVLTFGYLSDFISRKKLYLISLLLFIILFMFLFKLPGNGSFIYLVVFIFIYQTFISSMTVCFYPMLSENFPTEVRFTGVAFCYNIVYALTSLIPLAVNYLYKVYPGIKTIIFLFILVAAISLICSFFISDYTGKQMKN